MPPSLSDFFAAYEPVPKNPIEEAKGRFIADPRPTDPSFPPSQRRHYLAQGVLLNNKSRPDKDFQGNPINGRAGELFGMASVIEAKRRFAEELVRGSAIDGYPNSQDPRLLELENLTQRIVFGDNSPLISDGKIATVPLPGMVQAFETIAELIHKKHPGVDTVLTASNSYEGYRTAFENFFPHLKRYRHATPDSRFDLESFVRTMEAIEHPEQVLLLLQADSFNYTGVNPNPEQKRQIVEAIKRKGILTLVDSAYQGLANGLEEDTEIIRLLAKENLPFIVYDSWSKKAHLYAWRVAFAHFVTTKETEATTLRENLYALIRNRYLAVAPIYKIIYHLLKDPALREQWEKVDLPAARDILRSTKTTLAGLLGDSFEFVHPEKTQGMFNKFDITHKGSDVLAKEYGIFAVNLHDEDASPPRETIRVNMGGIPEDCLEYIASSIKAVYETHKSP